MDIYLILITIMLINDSSLSRNIKKSTNLNLSNMFSLTTTESSLNHTGHSVTPIHFIYPTSNLTNEYVKHNVNTTLNRLRSLDNSFLYTSIKEGSSML